MSSPLRSVLRAFEDGARSRAEVTRTTGLRPETVDAAIEHLVRVGRVRAEPVSTSCPSGSCGGCPLSNGHGSGCGTATVAVRPSGAALVTLSVVR